MGLLEKAYETYNNFASHVGVVKEGYVPLLPIYHILQNVGLEVVIDKNGIFQSASLMGKGDNSEKKAIIPVTLASSGRNLVSTNPHPLSDRLSVISPFDKTVQERYLAGLKSWVDSDFTDDKLVAIYKYVVGGTILDDVASLIKLYDKSGKVVSKKLDIFVFWRVLNVGEESRCYMDCNLFAKHIARMDSIIDDLFTEGSNLDIKDKEFSSLSYGLCYVTGEQTVLTNIHPKNTVPANYAAKLLSGGNGEALLGTKGRFTNVDQAFGVGLKASLKAHAMLSWLVNNSSIMMFHKRYNNDSGSKHRPRNYFGNRTFICWNPKGKPVPTESMLSSKLIFDDDEDIITGEDNINDLQNDKLNEDDFVVYKAKFNNELRGYSQEFSDNDEIIVASFSAATTGRLSLTYYSEMKASVYLKTISDWFDSLVFPCYTKHGYRYVVPSLYNICLYAFGVERTVGDSERINISNSDEGIFGDFYQLLNSCMLNRSQIPYELVSMLVNKASLPSSYSKRYNYNKVLYTACAVLRKYLNHKFNKEVYSMSLQEDKKDRSYQFGRLLAVLEKVERDDIDFRNEKREPNAVRLQTVFKEQPLHYANVLQDAINPYLRRLKPGIRSWYRKTISEIVEKISDFPEEEINRPLGDTYLLGYYLQRKTLYSKRVNNTEEELNIEEEIDNN